MKVDKEISHTLTLIDYHPLVPFIVRSYQFTSRAAAFSKNSNSSLNVEIWLPEPFVDNVTINRKIGQEIPENLISFGPSRERVILGKKLTLTFIFRKWVKKQLEVLSKKTKPIVYLRTLNLAAALVPTLKSLGIPYIFETHELFFESARKKSQTRAIEEYVYSNAALVIPISETLAEDVQSEFGVPTPIILASGHNNSLSNVPVYDSAAEPRFLYIGSLHRWKGLEPFLLSTKKLQIPTDIIGDAGGLDRLKKFIDDHHLSHVVLHGQQEPESLSKFYTKGAICILPLSNEPIAQRYTSPLKLFEYASAGRPVMVGSTPTISSIKDIENSVYLVKDDWFKECEHLLSNPKKREELAENSRIFAQQYTWSQIATTLLESNEFTEIIRV